MKLVRTLILDVLLRLLRKFSNDDFYMDRESWTKLESAFQSNLGFCLDPDALLLTIKRCIQLGHASVFLLL